MLTHEQMNEIRTLVENYWIKEVRSDYFMKVASGKEVGHKIGDMVDESTTQLLKNSGLYEILHQTSKGSAASRSMGDFWLKANGIFNPINVKAGEFGKNGQPNLVSLKRVLSALSTCLIDSYYLLIMKIEKQEQEIIPHVYLVDMLDFLDFTTFNSGPGQMMLKESQFYPNVDRLYEAGKYFPDNRLTVQDKISKLYEMLERADVSLIKEREKKRKIILDLVTAYPTRPNHTVNPLIQKDHFSLG